jgi:hypothetical protein
MHCLMSRVVWAGKALSHVPGYLSQDPAQHCLMSQGCLSQDQAQHCLMSRVL